MSQPIKLNLQLHHLLTLPTHDKLFVYEIHSYLNGHAREIACVPYLLKADNEAVTLMNKRAALYKIKSISMEIGAVITNLSDYEPSCPTCRSEMLTEDVSGELCCHNCGEEGPISQFFVGGIDSNYLKNYLPRI